MEKAKTRRADVLAGKGSLAGMLKKRREAIEAGDPSGGQMASLETEEIVNQGYRKRSMDDED